MQLGRGDSGVYLAIPLILSFPFLCGQFSPDIVTFVMIVFITSLSTQLIMHVLLFPDPPPVTLPKLELIHKHLHPSYVI